MNTHDSLLNEISCLEGFVAATSALLEQYERRHAELYARLDDLTRPKLVSPCVPSRRYLYPGFKFDHTWSTYATSLDVYRGLLKRLWVELPEKRQTIAQAMQARGRLCRYVSQDRHTLFSRKSAGWVAKHSEPLGDGWYIDTLLNPDRMHQLLAVAVRAAGLRQGIDVEFRVRGKWESSAHRPEATGPINTQ